MKNTNPGFYELKLSDKVVFIVFFVLLFITLVLIRIEGDLFTHIYSSFIIAVNPVVCVYFIVFKWLDSLIENERRLVLIIRIALYIALVLLVQATIYNYLNGLENEPTNSLADDLMATILLNLITGGVLLGIIMLKKRMETQIAFLESSNLQKSNELKLLKSQINPHFLFNNLNTLDALIDTDIERAKPYIQRLAKLYQYLLITQKEDTVELERELRFAKDYIYLIKERFGENYQFKIKDERTIEEEVLIPPCAVQTVFENIVKHNNVSRNNPIETMITLQDEQLIIRNNIRRKTKPEVSYGVGLSNLKSRYEIICNRSISIQVDEYYTITLPLIKTVNIKHI